MKVTIFRGTETETLAVDQVSLDLDGVVCLAGCDRHGVPFTIQVGQPPIWSMGQKFSEKNLVDYLTTIARELHRLDS